MSACKPYVLSFLMGGLKMEAIIPFVAAFFIGGAFCAFFQMIQDHTHSIPPKILLVGIGAGFAV